MSFWCQKKNKMEQRKNSLRLQNYDYSSLGAYFITICIHGRESIFGRIKNQRMYISKSGKIVKNSWLEIPDYNDKIRLDDFIIMPNHIHAIIWLVGAIHESPKNYLSQNITLQNKRVIRELPLQNRRNMLISKVIGKFKMNSAKQINLLRKTPGHKVWQRGYYDHIIRNQDDLNNTKQYIIDNPQSWEKDENFIEN